MRFLTFLRISYEYCIYIIFSCLLPPAPPQIHGLLSFLLSQIHIDMYRYHLLSSLSVVYMYINMSAIYIWLTVWDWIIFRELIPREDQVCFLAVFVFGGRSHCVTLAILELTM